MKARKYTIESLHSYANTKGGKCLSSTYFGSAKKHRFECILGHKWSSTWSSIINQGTWCPECASARGAIASQKYTLNELSREANSKNCELLDKAFSGILSTYSLRCNRGHRFNSVGRAIFKNKSLCKICTRKDSEGLTTRCHEKAKSWGGKFLSQTFQKAKTHYKWSCDKGHIFEATWDNVLQGTWCSTCRGRIPHSITDMRKLAISRGGKCLSTKYTSARSSLKWECVEGHRWNAIPDSIIRGSWCRKCAGSNTRKRLLKYTLEDCKNLASEKGGKILSTHYGNYKEPLLWECSEKHKWKTSIAQVLLGRWCPECSTSRSERICRSIFEEIYQTTFSKGRPAWLINSRGHRMEFDGYSKKLGIAFEHHGEQHFTTKTHYITNSKQLDKRKADDKHKAKLAKQNGVTLIEIPAVGHRIKEEDLLDWVKTKLTKLKILPDTNFPEEINYKKVFSTGEMTEVRDFAIKHGAVFLGNVDSHLRKKYRFKCTKGHEFSADISRLRSGKFCTKCASLSASASRRKFDLNSLNDLAKRFGGSCLSTHYENTRSNIHWVCKRGHRFSKIVALVKQGNWCPTCSGRSEEARIEECKTRASKHAGSFLGKRCPAVKAEVIWQCKRGHKFKKSLDAIRRGTWCRHCRKESL